MNSFKAIGLSLGFFVLAGAILPRAKAAEPITMAAARKGSAAMESASLLLYGNWVLCHQQFNDEGEKMKLCFATQAAIVAIERKVELEALIEATTALVDKAGRSK